MTSATAGKYPDLDLYAQAEFVALMNRLPIDEQLTARADRARAFGEVALGNLQRPKGPYRWPVV